MLVISSSNDTVATTEITTSSDCHNITLEPSIGVSSHGNYRELYIGTSAEHPVDLTQEYESEGGRNEIFMIGFPDGQSSQRRIQRPAFARHTESPSTTAIDLSGSEDHDVQLLEWADEDPDSFPSPIVAALLHENFEASSTPDPHGRSSQGRPGHCFVGHCNRTIR